MMNTIRYGAIGLVVLCSAIGLLAEPFPTRSGANPALANPALAKPVWANPAWKEARPDYPWSFPADHWARPGYKNEWWYFTGQVASEEGRRFGYQFTFFRIGLFTASSTKASNWAAPNLIMGHAAVSDLQTNDHRFSEALYRATPLLGGFGVYPDPRLAWSRGPSGTDGDWQLRWNGNGFDFEMRDDAKRMAFSLSTQARKALVLQGPNGYSRKDQAASAASQYDSFTRLQTTGRITLDGKTWNVSGSSWMDKEFGSNQLTDDQVGWDWFSLQLDDQREIMLYILRRRDGAIDFAKGALIESDGQPRHLDQHDMAVIPQAHWKSPHTSAVYPSSWLISIPQANLNLEVAAKMADQENRSRLISTLHYWEGAVSVRRQGQPVGQGYVELTGYANASRPAL